MTAGQFIFYTMAFIMVAFSVFTIFSRNILRSAFYLFCVLVTTSFLYFMLGYEFMAGVQLILYVGGIVVLIVFSILLTSHIGHKFPWPSKRKLMAGVTVSLAGFLLAVKVLCCYPFPVVHEKVKLPGMKEIGRQLLDLDTRHSGYALPFEIIGILLLAAMVGAIMIAKKEK